MKKLKMARSVTLTFEEGCNKYLANCRQRNLREGTINHYITQNYINLLVSEVAKQVDEFNVLDKFYGRTHNHIIYGDIKTRYNVFRKNEYDVFGARILQLKRLIL